MKTDPDARGASRSALPSEAAPDSSGRMGGGIPPLDGARNESLYRALIESSRDSIKILDLNGRLLSMNPRGQHLMEIDEIRSWLHKPWTAFWAEQHHEEIGDALQLARDGRTGRFEGFRTTAKGKPKWWDVLVTPIMDDSGQPHQLLAIARDITDRKRAEDAVRTVAEASFVVTESLDYKETLTNVAKVLIPSLADWCVIDIPGADGTIEAATIMHSDPEKIKVVEEMRRRYPPRADASAGTAAVMRTGEPQVVPEITTEMLRAWTKDDDHMRMAQNLGLRSFAAVPLKARGRSLGAIAIVSSRNERTYTEDDLPLLDELGRIAGLAVDNARLYKAAKGELAERRKAEAKLRDLNETLERRVEERTEALEKVNRDLKAEINVREQAERTLEEINRQLTSRNRELQEFAYAASHDLQEPLRKVTSFVDLMRSDFEHLLPSEGVEYLDRIQHAAIRMSQLIRDLLAYSRVETQRQPTRHVNLNRVLADVLVDLEIAVVEADAVVESGDLPVIQADKGQMRQLFQNLLSNALKFRQPDEKLTIHVDAKRCDADDAWILTFRDNGIGFEERYAKRIFSPFQRLHEKRKYPGTGIGLAICRRIVERHDGNISVSSEPGVGSTFTIRLPDWSGR